MKVTGIIAEYNPLHSGHQYHLDTARLHTGADYLVVVMSGDYTQRGIPAIMDKYLRTHMALLAGADLVLELPLPWAVGSAEYFAMGSVTLLDKLGVIDHLCFGSERGDTALLSLAAQILADEPESYRKALQLKLAEGLSFPAAQAYGLEAAMTCDQDNALARFQESDSPLSSPNNRLGIEYMKALKRRGSSILPVTIKREGAGYHDETLYEKNAGTENLGLSCTDSLSFSSASAIRKALLQAGAQEKSARQIPPEIYGQIPTILSPIYEQAWKQSFPLSPDDFSQILHYKLLTEVQAPSQTTSGQTAKASRLTDYWDVTCDLSDRISNLLPLFTGYSDFCDSLKTKNLTYTRISRSLLHILLNIRNDQIQAYITDDYVPYARILGFRKNASPLLRAIKEHSSIPLISKLADADKLLMPGALNMLRQELTASHIYEAVKAAKFGAQTGTTAHIKNEYTREIMIL